MLKLQHFLPGAALTLVIALLVSAQTTSTTPAELSILIGENKVKFTPLRQYQELRLEIFNSTSELIYDSGSVAEAELNWNLHDSNGQRLAPGLYAYALSIKVPDAEAPHKHQGHFIIEKGKDQIWLTTKGDGAVGAEVTGGELTVARSPERTTVGTGQLASGRTLGERAGLQRDNKDRTVADKNNGVTREGNPFPLNISGSGTTSRLTKWLNGPSGVVGDSVLHETASGDLGIGTTAPGGVLDVVRSSSNPLIGRFWNTGTGPAQLRFVGGTGSTSQFLITDSAEWLTSIAVSNSIGMQFRVRDTGTTNNEAQLTSSPRMTILRNGNVGVGTTAPGKKFTVQVSGMGISHSDGAAEVGTYAGGGFAYVQTHTNHPLHFATNNSQPQMILTTAGNLGVGTTSPATRLHVVGNTRTDVLQITGGADFAENFDVTLPEEASRPGAAQGPEPGSVVAIDPQHPGKLKISTRAYDHRIAGIISGAGGVNPGMIVGQTGSIADGRHPVAIGGRVYCLVDASFGAIQPGDLLTSSTTPGHARKVGSRTKAQGAIIGKAMTGLKEGKGLVLVLVTLQ